jgi:hypothetical protein
MSRAGRCVVLCLAAITHGAVVPALGADAVRLEISTRAPLPSARPIAYELLSGVVHGEVDPADPRNAIVNDLQLAPRNARGLVAYTATFSLAKPVDMAKASGLLFYDVPNRGNGKAVADGEGNVHLVSGWQGDLPPAAGRQSLAVPIAHSPGGGAITGPILVRFTDVPAGTASVAITGSIGQGVPRPEPVTLDTAQASLWRKSGDHEAGTPIAASDWAFADCTQVPFPGRPDPHSLCLRAGFDARYAYELRYEGKDPPVLGLGFVAVRDLVDFLRHDPGAADAPNPVAGQLHHAIITGMSQSGNFVRSYIHLGFNEGAAGRPVFDGALPYIAARQVPLNFRFAVPGGAATLYEPGSEGVLWWGRYDDRVRKRGTTSLLERCHATHTCPLVVEVFGATELWGLRMSPDLVGTDARADIPLPGNVRRYYLPGVTHGGGMGGFETDPAKLPGAPGCTLAGNPNPAYLTYNALQHALAEWVQRGVEPPPSVYPRLQRHELVPVAALARRFPKGAGLPDPVGKLNEFLAYDFGPGFIANDLSGALTRLPPAVDDSIRSLVVPVDADGNETVGVASVQHQVPLGTYLGWNVRARGYYAGTGCDFQGGYVPFARTKAERFAVGDPRPSLAERYGTHAAFVERVRKAAARMVAQRFLLPADAAEVVRKAEASQVLVPPPAAAASAAVPH